MDDQVHARAMPARIVWVASMLGGRSCIHTNHVPAYGGARVRQAKRWPYVSIHVQLAIDDQVHARAVPARSMSCFHTGSMSCFHAEQVPADGGARVRLLLYSWHEPLHADQAPADGGARAKRWPYIRSGPRHGGARSQCMSSLHARRHELLPYGSGPRCWPYYNIYTIDGQVHARVVPARSV